MKVTNRLVIGVMLLICSCSAQRTDAGEPVSRVSNEVERPNIIFLFADDQRADTISAYGNPFIKTPHLDRLAEEGFSLRQNYCAGSYSGAVCTASRAMLMTGRQWMRIPNGWKGIKTFPRLLSENGYKTFIVGKWHNGIATLKASFQEGESIFMGGMSDHTKVLVQKLHDGSLTKAEIAKGFSSQIFADSAIKFIGNRDRKSPFLLYVAFTAPHDPRMPPMAYRQLYYDKRPPLPGNFMPQHPFDNGFVTSAGRDEGLAPWPRTKGVISDQLCEYYGLITHLDQQIGRIMNALKASGQADNTIVIYTADHGLALGSHGLLGKQNIYEHSMKSPLIISGPGIPKGKSSDAFTYIHDLNATVCDLTGTLNHSGLDGKSLKGLWKGDIKEIHAAVYLPFQRIMRSVRVGHWKLHVYPRINHKLLFDLEKDPLEMHDLAGDPAYADKIHELTGKLKKWQNEIGDQQPLKVSHPAEKEIDLTGAKRKLDVWQPKWIRDKYFDGRNDPDHGPQIRRVQSKNI